MAVKVGLLYGNGDGGESFNDAQDCSLNFDESIIAVTSGGSDADIDYVTFTYSNGQSKQHGQSTYQNSSCTHQFDLYSDEYIDGVTVYTGTRFIINLSQLNGTLLVIGLRFHTNQGRLSGLFGSSNGTEMNEYLPNYKLGYVRGQALGYVYALQFIWYIETLNTATALLPVY
jgi:hypothetical protein